MKKYVCKVCGYVYDPAAGDPDSGIAPGTALKISPPIGVVLSAVWAKTILNQPSKKMSGGRILPPLNIFFCGVSPL